MKMTMAAARVNAGLRQMDVCEAMNVSQKTLIEWERGRKYPRINDLQKFCEICNCSIEDIEFEGMA